MIFITFFPRLTLLFSSVAFGGFLWWLGFFFMPRLLVACLATYYYWPTNPVLVFISWFVALTGEVFEKWGITGRKRFIYRSYRTEVHPEPTHIPRDGAIEAEFTKES